MVTSYLTLLERRYAEQLDDTAREFIHYAVDGAARMRDLLDDLLRYSRAGAEGSRRERVELAALLDGVLRSLEPAIAEADAAVRLEGPLPVLSADPVQLGQLLQNLVANAVKFRSPERGNRIVVSATRDDEAGAWRLAVEDDGIGIEPRQHERIFQLFQRLHSAEEYPGTGIGLAICRRIAERLGVALTLVSAPGAGSTFTVVLPDEPGAGG